LVEFYSTNEMMIETGIDYGDKVSDLLKLKKYFISKGFDGIEFRELDGAVGVFVCLFHAYPIQLTSDAKESLEVYDMTPPWDGLPENEEENEDDNC